MDKKKDSLQTFVLLGLTGAGKSSTGNKILNHDTFEVSDNLYSCTDKIQFGVNQKNNLQVIDCIGYSDTNRFSNEDISHLLRDLAQNLILTKTRINCFLLVVSFSQRLFSFKTDLDETISIFGNQVLKSLIVVFISKKDEPIDKSKLMAQIKQMDEILKIMNLNKDNLTDNWFILWNNNRPYENQFQDLLEKTRNMAEYTSETLDKIKNEVALDYKAKNQMKNEMKKIKRQMEIKAQISKEELILKNGLLRLDTQLLAFAENHLSLYKNNISIITSNQSLLNEQKNLKIVELNKYWDNETKNAKSRLDLNLSRELTNFENQLILAIEKNKNTSFTELNNSFTTQLTSINNHYNLEYAKYPYHTAQITTNKNNSITQLNNNLNQQRTRLENEYNTSKQNELERGRKSLYDQYNIEISKINRESQNLKVKSIADLEKDIKDKLNSLSIQLTEQSNLKNEIENYIKNFIEPKSFNEKVVCNFCNQDLSIYRVEMKKESISLFLHRNCYVPYLKKSRTKCKSCKEEICLGNTFYSINKESDNDIYHTYCYEELLEILLDFNSLIINK